MRAARSPASSVTPGAQAAGHREIVTVVVCVGIELERHPYIWRGSELIEVEIGADNPYHRVGLAAQRHGGAERRRVAAELRDPEVMAQDDDAVAARKVFGGRKSAAAQYRCAQQPEIVRAHLTGSQLLRSCHGRRN